MPETWGRLSLGPSHYQPQSCPCVLCLLNMVSIIHLTDTAPGEGLDTSPSVSAVHGHGMLRPSVLQGLKLSYSSLWFSLGWGDHSQFPDPKFFPSSGSPRESLEAKA